MAKLYWRIKRDGRWTWTPVKFRKVNWWYTATTLLAEILDPDREEEE
jgi:hypothetical protein